VLRGPDEFDVFGYDTRTHCVYDLDGWASELAHGILLESIRIAASRFGARADIDLPGTDDRPRRYHVRLRRDAAGAPDPLGDAIVRRTVQRRAMRPRPVDASTRKALEDAAQPFRVAWFETPAARTKVAAINAANARIRLTIPEAYEVHRSVIAWNTTTSNDRMPDASLGADPLLLSVMRHAMKSWKRLDTMNRLTGTWLPRLALDVVPGVLCSAHLVLCSARPLEALGDRIEAGAAVQRLWLAATQADLQMQPQYTPLVFARYAREQRPFSHSAGAMRDAQRVRERLEALIGADVDRIVWLARIGPQRAVPGRSMRLPLAELIVTQPPAALPRLTAADATSSA
jgi:hypothetical protein